MPFIRFPDIVPFEIVICVPSVPSGIGVARRISKTSPAFIVGVAGIVIVVIPAATEIADALYLVI